MSLIIVAGQPGKGSLELKAYRQWKFKLFNCSMKLVKLDNKSTGQPSTLLNRAE
jgi:hypothetical protein